jgi:hypothetical protein
MPGMILNPTRLLDQVRDPSGRPQSGFIPQRLRTPLQRSPNALQFPRPESWLATCPARPLQAAASLALQLPRPPADGLPVHPHLAGHLRLTDPLAQQLRRPQAMLFQGHKVSSYSSCISHAERLPQAAGNVTILCESQ